MKKISCLILILYISIPFAYAETRSCYNCVVLLKKISDLDECNSTKSATEDCENERYCCGSFSNFLEKNLKIIGVYYQQSCLPHKDCNITPKNLVHFEDCNENLCNAAENLSYQAKQNISRALNSINNTTMSPSTSAYRTSSAILSTTFLPSSYSYTSNSIKNTTILFTASAYGTSSVILSTTFLPSNHSSASNSINNITMASTASVYRASSTTVSPTFFPSSYNSTSNAIQNSSSGSLLLFSILSCYLYKKLF